MGHDTFNPSLTAVRKYQGQEPRPLRGDFTNCFETPLTFEPGESWVYSCGINWAGQMVERATGNARLGDYMSEHICKPLGMASAIFRLRERPDLADRLCGMTARTPTGKLVANPPMSLHVKEPRDDESGAGVNTTSPDYLRLLTSLFKNDVKLLKPKTVDETFKLQLENLAYLADALAKPGIGKHTASGLPSGIKWDCGLGGILNMEDIPGRARKATMFWGGLPNLQWVRFYDHQLKDMFTAYWLHAGSGSTERRAPVAYMLHR